MKAMLFNDKDNFDGCIRALNRGKDEGNKRFFKLDKCHELIFKKISSLHDWSSGEIKLVRTYIYTGRYTSKILESHKKYCNFQIKRFSELIDKEDALLGEIAKHNLPTTLKNKVDDHVTNVKAHFQKQKEDYLKNLDKQKRKSNGQKVMFDIIERMEFAQLKTTPLKHATGVIYQKGVDVQLATDLVHFAHCNSYDIAVILGGDTDLIESVKLVRKNLGKIVIIAAYFDEDPLISSISPKLIEQADYFINLKDLTNAEINSISEPMRPKTIK